MPNVERISAATDPDAANAAVAAAIAPEYPEAPPPPILDVSLPVGIGLLDGTWADWAEVRELNGEDEEEIERSAAKPLRTQQVLLERAVTKIGQAGGVASPVGASLSLALTIADRTALMIAIRQVTYGDTIEGRFKCVACAREMGAVVQLSKDVPNRINKTPGKREFVVPLRRGEAIVRYPTGGDQMWAVGDGTRLATEVNTLLLERCVLSINGMPPLGTAPLRQLNSADRRALLAAVFDMPGPQLEEVTVDCMYCSASNALPMSTTDIFRL